MQEESTESALYRQAQELEEEARILSSKASTIYRAAGKIKQLAVELATRNETATPETQSK